MSRNQGIRNTTPEGRIINFTGGWNAYITSGDNFGYDPNWEVFAAFVDTADKGTTTFL